MNPPRAAPVLRVDGLTVSFRASNGLVPAVRGVDLAIRRGETLALVGESGSGKSAAVLGMLGLFHRSAAFVGADRFEFEANRLTVGDRAALRPLLGTRIGVIFQDPQSSLNPTMRVGRQIGEVLTLRERQSRRAVRERILESLHEVGIRDPIRCADMYPHQLSGGMRQRAMISMATITDPALLIADEPTTALDVTLQAQVVELLAAMQARHGLGILFITHDLSLVSQFADRVMVMYAGRVVESGPIDAVVSDPQHPYTAALLACVPRVDGGRVKPIPGRPPDPRQLPPGCPFQPRCASAVEACATEPMMVELSESRRARCWVAERTVSS